MSTLERQYSPRLVSFILNNMVFTTAFLGFITTPILVPFLLIYGTLTLTGSASGTLLLYIAAFLFGSSAIGLTLGLLRFRKVEYNMYDDRIRGTKGLVRQNQRTILYEDVERVEQIQTPFQELLRAQTIVLHLEKDATGNGDTWFDKRFTVSKSVNDDTIQIDDIHIDSEMFDQIKEKIESETDEETTVEYVTAEN